MQPTHGQYRPEIDGLRAVAVGAVVLYHALPSKVPGGFVGVDVFFVISGYLISSIIARRLSEGDFSLSGFYAARIRRIFPALIVVITAVLACGWLMFLKSDFRSLGRDAAAGAFFVSNLVSWSDVGYFAAEASQKPLLHLWSLGIEEQFYFVWPVLMMAGSTNKRRFLVLSVTIGTLSFGVSTWLAYANPTAAYYSPFSRAWELMAGAILAFWHPRLPWRVREFSPAIGITVIIGCCFAFGQTTPFPGFWALLPVGATALIIGAGPEPWVSRKLIAVPPLVWMGLISYPLYLWHWPLLSIPSVANFGEPIDLTMKVMALAAAFILAALTYFIVEIPIRRRISPSILFSMMAILGCVSLAVYFDRVPARALDTDPRWEFVEHYVDMHEHHIADTYHSECDFYDWVGGQKRQAIAQSCTPAGARTFLWGDSHAQALSYGLRELFAGGAFAQVATSGCRPSLTPIADLTPGQACNPGNDYARRAIERLRPDTVILAQRYHHEKTDWQAIARWLQAQHVRHVVLVGPLPEWLPSLPNVIAKYYWGSGKTRIASGLDPDIFLTDKILETRYGSSSDLTFVSLVDGLCNRRGCLAVVPGDRNPSLMAMDYAHLTASGSNYVAKSIIGRKLGFASKIEAHAETPASAD